MVDAEARQVGPWYSLGMPRNLSQNLKWPDPEDIEKADMSRMTLIEERFCQLYAWSGRPDWSYCKALDLPEYDAKSQDASEIRFAASVRSRARHMRMRVHNVARVLEIGRELLDAEGLTRAHLQGRILSIAQRAGALADKDDNARFLKVELDAWKALADMGGYVGKLTNVTINDNRNQAISVTSGEPPRLSLAELNEKAKNVNLIELGGDDYEVVQQPPEPEPPDTETGPAHTED